LSQPLNKRINRGESQDEREVPNPPRREPIQDLGEPVPSLGTKRKEPTSSTDDKVADYFRKIIKENLFPVLEEYQEKAQKQHEKYKVESQMKMYEYVNKEIEKKLKIHNRTVSKKFQYQIPGDRSRSRSPARKQSTSSSPI